MSVSAVEFTRLIRRVEALEALAHTLSQQMADLQANVSVSHANISESHSAFVQEVMNSIGTSMSMSVDIAKAKIMEELKVYLDARVAVLASKTADIQAKVDSAHAVASTAATSAADAASAAAVSATAAAAAASASFSFGPPPLLPPSPDPEHM